MKKIILILALLLGWSTVTLQAQNVDKQVAHIRSMYNQVKKEIAALKPNDPNNAYYLLRCENNGWAKPFPAVGVYHITTDFYYRFDEETLDRQLIMVIQTAEQAANKRYTEILYERNKCIFYYENDPYESNPEKRLYMDPRGNTIRYTEGTEKIGPNDESAETLFKDKALDFQEYFYLL